MSNTIRVLLVQGHRNTSGGNARESALTPHAARAIQHALRAAGHTADMLQPESNWWAGSLDSVGREVVRRHREDPYDLMLDVHFEGDSNNTRGVFAIVPDGDGLTSLTRYTGSDAWETNTLDIQYAEAITAGIAQTTALRQRTVGVMRPGVMSERQTGVGGKGYRLAMFGYTAPVRDRLVRLVLELGNIIGDERTITAPGFYAAMAQGVVNGIQQVVEASKVTPIGKPVTAAMPPHGQLVRLKEPAWVRVNVDALNVRKWAATDQPVIRTLKRGNTFWARGWIVGEVVEGNPIWWVMGSGRPTDVLWRVWSGGTHRTVDEILALPTKEAA